MTNTRFELGKIKAVTFFHQLKAYSVREETKSVSQVVEQNMKTPKIIVSAFVRSRRTTSCYLLGKSFRGWMGFWTRTNTKTTTANNFLTQKIRLNIGFHTSSGSFTLRKHRPFTSHLVYFIKSNYASYIKTGVKSSRN